MTARTVTAAAAKRDFDKVLEALKDGPVSITRAGKLIAVLSPPAPRSGCMAGSARILVDDIVGIDTSEDWGRLA